MTAENGADYILAGGLTLFGQSPADCKTLYYRFLNNYYSGLIKKYLALYGENHYPSWDFQNQLRKKAERLCKKYNIRNSIL